MRNGSNLRQQSPSNAMVWQKIPSFVNGAGAPGLPQMPSFPRTPAHVLRASHIDHHVGSAPVVTGSPWDRQHSYLGVASSGSLGNAGFHGRWQLHLPDLSRNMFSHVGGNVNDLISNVGQGSPKQLSHAAYCVGKTTGQHLWYYFKGDFLYLPIDFKNSSLMNKDKRCICPNGSSLTVKR
ncbi:hypothetical protein P8452_66994 [Trifolium repens]|nr:hypothetical protein P8452_66994 [Trifolium repens]